jgi:diguanylate cyclase (GGDEF)-like protein
VLLLLVSAVAVGAWTVLEVDTVSGTATAVSGATVLLLVVAAALYRVVPPERLDRAGAGVLAGLVSVALVCVLRVVTDDPSVAAHAFLTLPVLWSSVHLHRDGVVLVTAAALAGDAATLLLLEPAGRAVSDVLFSGAVLVAVAVLLARAAATQARLVAALGEQATLDALTGLVNRRVFDEALDAGPRGPGTALVLIDVDAFKAINDAHGHPVGDEVLVHLAAVLREQVRSDDAVLSRLGGDELAVLLRGCTPATAARRAEALLAAVRSAPVPLPSGERLHLSISVGVAHRPGRAGDLRGLYASADGALYEAKRAGRGRVAIAAA